MNDLKFVRLEPADLTAAWDGPRMLESDADYHIKPWLHVKQNTEIISILFQPLKEF